MTRGRLIITVLFTILALGLLSYFAFFLGGDKRFQWYENYKAESEQPYGTLFIRQMLEDYRPDGNFTYSDKRSIHEILDSTESHRETAYVFIGQSNYLDANDVVALAEFMEQGNDVFIASLTPPVRLIARINQSECVPELTFSYDSERVDEVSMNFYHDSLRANDNYVYAFRFAGTDRPYFWNYLNNDAFCGASNTIVPLGYLDGDVVNFMRIPHGQGNLYLHTNPIVFTNYFLTRPVNVEYAEGVFSHLSGRDIIWDEYSKLPFTENNNEYNSPLYFIMQQPSLKYAWWMMLVVAGLFVFFAARRRQRVIPVLEAKTNTSLEFVTLISSLYYQNGNHLDIAKKKMKYFLYFIRARYGIHTAALTQPQVALLAEKSQVKESDIQHIYESWNLIDKFAWSSVEPERLVDLYYAIDTFYKKCK